MASTVSPEPAVRAKPSASSAPRYSPRLSLQRAQRRIMRRHLFRSFARVKTLIVADVAAFWLLRGLVRGVRDQGWLGAWVGEWAGRIFPTGYLAGWQVAAALVVGLAVTGNYNPGDHRRDSARLLRGVFFGSALTLWYPLWQFGVEAVLVQFAGTVAALWLALLGERTGIDAFVTRFLPPRRPVERVVLVGEPGHPSALGVQRSLFATREMVPLGWITTDGRPPGQVVLGSVDEFWQVLHDARPDTVVLCGRVDDSVFEAVVSASMSAGCRLLAVPRYEGLTSLRPGLVWHRGMPFVELTVPTLRAQQLLIKRVIDMAGSIVGLLLLAPVFGLVALTIKLDSRGPVLFSQDRVGLGGRVFRMWKFRTMRNGAHEERHLVDHLNHTGDKRLFKIPDDPRVTRVGRWLRRWSIDELPQLWNVFLGGMSLVGPRPFFESDLPAYLDHHFVRLGAKPGITGLWQVNGRSSVVDFEEVVRLDREYIERWSLWLDLKIVFLTLPAVLRRTGAY